MLSTIVYYSLIPIFLLAISVVREHKLSSVVMALSGIIFLLQTNIYLWPSLTIMLLLATISYYWVIKFKKTLFFPVLLLSSYWIVSKLLFFDFFTNIEVAPHYVPIAVSALSLHMINNLQNPGLALTLSSYLASIFFLPRILFGPFTPLTQVRLSFPKLLPAATCLLLALFFKLAIANNLIILINSTPSASIGTIMPLLYPLQFLAALGVIVAEIISFYYLSQLLSLSTHNYYQIDSSPLLRPWQLSIYVDKALPGLRSLIISLIPSPSSWRVHLLLSGILLSLLSGYIPLVQAAFRNSFIMMTSLHHSPVFRHDHFLFLGITFYLALLFSIPRFLKRIQPHWTIVLTLCIALLALGSGDFFYGLIYF